MEREVMNESTKLTEKSARRTLLFARIPRALLLIPFAVVSCLAMQSWSLIQGIGDEADDGLVVLGVPNPMAVREVIVATARAVNASNAPALAAQTQTAPKPVLGSE